MKKSLQRVNLSLKHLRVLNQIFSERKNFNNNDKIDYEIYIKNLRKLKSILKSINAYDELYNHKSRQMILADLIEYILLGRIYYSMQPIEKRCLFIKCLLHIVNLLMTYESITVNTRLRNKFLNLLQKTIPSVKNEEYFNDLKRFIGPIGLPKKDTKANKKLNRYFDKMLPKTAGGLWHELLVYAFLIRNDYGFVLPLLLSQRIFSKNDHLVPPDFLILTHDKRIYGIEVGTKKEIQSGSFSLRTAIPTATVDTINSRSSDRCPICKRWIHFCPYIIDKFSNFDFEIQRNEIKCLKTCKLLSEKDIVNGKCPYTKYSRKKVTSLNCTHHKYADGLHYHYSCILNNVPARIKKRIIKHKDNTAIKTHYPYYSGLDVLGE